jgi:hypothetical protein
MAESERIDALRCGSEAKLLDGVMFSTFRRFGVSAFRRFDVSTFRLPIHLFAIAACSAVNYPG